jgi:thiamine pyrophosphokinase
VTRGGAEDQGRPLAVVFLDGEYGDPAWHRALAMRADIVLAADGGARFLAGIGVTPDAVVGDFDSLDPAIAARLEREGVAFVRHPVRKDVTDGELAVDEAGATGALDHTLGHLAILRRQAGRGVVARLVAPGLSATVLIAPVSVRLAAAAGARVSLVPLGDDATVSLTGLDYPLDRGVLPTDACLGIGNHVSTGGAAVVVIHQGAVALLVESGDESFALMTGA